MKKLRIVLAVLSLLPSQKLNNMSTQFKPLADRVLIEPAAAEQTTARGLIIPDSAKEKP
jgi:hypothetical protein